MAAVTGGPAFTLTVNGVGFVETSQVRWNGGARPTAFVSTGQLQAQISAADIAASQTVAVTVFNPAPGGGVSPPADFVVGPANPVPDVTGLSPAQAMVGDGAFSITVIGHGFVPGATVLWNGEGRTTGFLNEFMLTATIRAEDLAEAGPAFVGVANPAPGGGPSLDARVFTIVYPAPVVGGLDPEAVWAGGPSFTLAVTGADFTRASVVQVAGVDLTTTFVSPERLEARVPATAITRAGPASVRVFTPAPGGGLSAATFLAVEDDGTPPVTVATGLTGLWYRTTAVITLTATDVGLGVEKTFYRIGRSGDYRIGTRVSVPAPRDHSNDGRHVVQFFSIDKVLNWEQPPKEVEVGIDTRGPATQVAAAKVKRGGVVKPRYVVNDALSPRARDALLQVLDRRGRVVLKQDLGRPATRTWRTGAGFVVSLPRGTYKMRVLAHDLAGNAQASTRSGTLAVY